MSRIVLRREKKSASAAARGANQPVRRKDRAGIPIQLRGRPGVLAYTQEMHSGDVARSTDVGHDYHASESSTGKRVAIIQRMQNNVVQRCGKRGNKNKADIIAQNRRNGRAFEQQEFAQFRAQHPDAVEQITIRTESGVRTRVDAIGTDANGDVVIHEYKSSATAPLTPRQTEAFPEITESGGTVVGKGKGNFTGGFQVPPGKEIIIVRKKT